MTKVKKLIVFVVIAINVVFCVIAQDTIVCIIRPYTEMVIGVLGFLVIILIALIVAISKTREK